MAAVTVTAANISPVFGAHAEIFPFIAGEALTAGNVVYFNSSGKVIKASGAASGTAKVAGIALQTVGAGQSVDVLKEGHLEGLTLTALAYGAKVYLSDTSGGFDTAAGTVSVVIGSVVPTSEQGSNKLLYVQSNWTAL